MSAAPRTAELMARGLWLPPKNSRAELVLAALRDGPCTIEKGILRHTDFGISKAKIYLIYDRLVHMGCAELRGQVYSASIRVQRYYDELEKSPAAAGQVAGPRYVPESRPLRPVSMHTAVRREGALDYRSMPSLMGDVRKLPNGEIVE